MLGFGNEFVITKMQTHGPGHGIAYQCSELSEIPLSYPGAPATVGELGMIKFFDSLCVVSSIKSFALVSVKVKPCQIGQHLSDHFEANFQSFLIVDSTFP